MIFRCHISITSEIFTQITKQKSYQDYHRMWLISITSEMSTQIMKKSHPCIMAVSALLSSFLKCLHKRSQSVADFNHLFNVYTSQKPRLLSASSKGIVYIISGMSTQSKKQISLQYYHSKSIITNISIPLQIVNQKSRQ